MCSDIELRLCTVVFGSVAGAFQLDELNPGHAHKSQGSSHNHQSIIAFIHATSMCRILVCVTSLQTTAGCRNC